MNLFEQIAQFSGVSMGVVTQAAAVFTRISALAFFLPGLSERVVSARIRLGVAMAVTLILLPLIGESHGVAIDTLSDFFLLVMAEAVTGALLGFSIRIIIYMLQIAGAIASQSLSLSQIFGATITSQGESPIASLLVMTGTVLALGAGLHIEAIKVLHTSYALIPIGVLPGSDATGEWASGRAGYAFAGALSLALPFVILGFVYNLALGAANRAMPQLMVSFVGVPAITLAGLALLAITAPILLAAWLQMVDKTLLTLIGGL